MVRTSRPLVERMTLVWHDWFATSNDGVGSQRLMLEPEPALPRARPRLVPRPAARRDAGPGDAALAERQRQLEVSPNENYGREMMELFTLGAGRGYTRGRRPPAGARADRLPERLAQRRRQRQLPLRPEAPRHRHEDDLPAARRVHLEGLGAARRHAPGPPELLRRASSGATSSRARPTPRPQRALEQPLRLERARRSGRSSTAILKHPALYDGPPAGEVAGRLHGRPAAPPRPRHRHDGVGVARRDGRAAALLSAERRRLGRHALARHRDLARPLVDRAVRARPYALDPGKAAQPYDAATLVDGALAFWQQPGARRELDARRAARVRADRARATRRATTWKQQAVPRR